MLLYVLLLVPSSSASPGEDAVIEAETYLGVPYRWNGRGTGRTPTLDCMGLPFRVYGKLHARSWRDYAVNPSELVGSGLLGTPVSGVPECDGDDVLPLLKPGDIVYFLTTTEIPDAPLWERDGVSYWPWHMGMYAGNGDVLHAKPGASVVREPLSSVGYQHLFATRPRHPEEQTTRPTLLTAADAPKNGRAHVP